MKRYRYIGEILNGFKSVLCNNGKWGFVDKNNNEVIPCIYEGVDEFNEYGTVVIRLNNNYGLIDQFGVEVVPPIYDVIQRFRGGFAGVRLKGKWGIVNKKGEIVIPCIYDSAENIRYELFLVSVNHVRLCIDLKLNYYTLFDERIHCEECPCYNDKMLTQLCCKFGE